ncbi:MAG: acetolactate synthase small subunit [Bacilli bacterium]|jgi:acetolactate synthase-1/3 small subunit
MENNKFIISALVSNQFGVLTRVAGLFARRGYNIESLAVGPIENSKYSRMTILVYGDDYVKEQISKQLLKLYDVKKVKILELDNSLVREHVLVKIKIKDGKNILINNLVNKYSGRIVDFSEESISVELTEDIIANEKFIEEAKEFGILEMCRAGALALNYGKEIL